MRLGARGVLHACVLVGGAAAACGTGAAITQGEWALSAPPEAGPMAAADVISEPAAPAEPMDWMVPTTPTFGASSSGGGSSSSSSSGGGSSSSGGGSSSGPPAMPCTVCASDSDCSSQCGPPPQTGYFWCCVKSVGQCASQSYACGTTSGSSSGMSSGSSSSGGPTCGGTGQACCSGSSQCPNSTLMFCIQNKCM